MRDRRITRAIGALLSRDRGALSRFASLAGVDLSTVSHWFSSDAERRYNMPVDALPCAIDALDSLEPARVALADVDLDVIPRAKVTHSPVPVHEGVWTLLSLVASLGQEVRDALADGRIDDREALSIRRTLVEARDVIDAMLARLPGGKA